MKKPRAKKKTYAQLEAEIVELKAMLKAEREAHSIVDTLTVGACAFLGGYVAGSSSTPRLDAALPFPRSPK